MELLFDKSDKRHGIQQNRAYSLNKVANVPMYDKVLANSNLKLE